MLLETERAANRLGEFSFARDASQLILKRLILHSLYQGTDHGRTGDAPPAATTNVAATVIKPVKLVFSEPDPCLARLLLLGSAHALSGGCRLPGAEDAIASDGALSTWH